ncbi:MAG: hypothetical protein ACJAVV_002659 [Alphaproteobacteria bacterium]|jgi:hypothetical protein
MNTIVRYKIILVIALGIFGIPVLADGIVVDKVYHPYVIANEREVEWRLMSSQTDKFNRLAQRLGLGYSVAENVAVEAYIIGERDSNQDFDISAYEIEARWMITEQGQYWADWGAVFEIERNTLVNSYETSVGIISEKEFEKTSLTLNLFLIYERGSQIKNEFETEFRAKYRYRFMPEIQPAIEIYAGENFFGIGPAIMGVHRFEGQEQIKWEAGFISELSNSGKDHTFRFSIEYEF